MTEHSATPPAGPSAAAVARDARLTEWTRLQAEIAMLQARANDVLAEALEVALEGEIPEHLRQAGTIPSRDIPVRSMVSEFALAARMSEITLEGMAFDARRLKKHLPDTYAALRAGEISLQHAREIAQVPIPADAPADTLAEFEFLVLDHASFTTPNRTRKHARALAQKLFPVDETTRHRRARQDRNIHVTDYDDGMSDLVVHAPTVIVHATFDRLTQIAKETQEAERAAARDAATTPEGEDRDIRTLDQVRADTACDMLLTSDLMATATGADGGTSAAAIRGRVQVTIPVRTAAGLSDVGAELDGVGFVEAELVRELAGLADGWDRLFVDPVTDTVVRTDRYRPTAGMQRHLRARDQHCRFPGCRAPVSRCQIDHSEDHARGGPTALGNLAHLCMRHHPLKHPDIADPHRWSVRQLSNGVLEWRSPAGRRYIDEPPPRVAFAAAA